MKLKNIERTANVAWSPRAQYPVYLACGTAAQQLDASFSTSAALEVYLFNPDVSGLECELVASAETPHRFNKLVWGGLGMSAGTHASGTIVGGTESGTVCVWDASKLIMEEAAAQMYKLEKHVGSVTALDFNKFQDNLLASGAGESDIYLWDLNSPDTPMTPGAKSAPADDVTSLAWNCQVQHILASCLNTRCVVWDLRKSEPIIKISDSMSRIRSKLVTWHPEVATQLVLASEDDHTPVAQLWDLRFAASPVKVMHHHEKGILSMAWSRADPELLLTCGKDNKLLCWNPNAETATGEVTYELPINQWCFDVQWCPRNPQCVSACSFDGNVSVYTIMGGELETHPVVPSSKIADSFGGFDQMAAPKQPLQPQKIHVPQISKAPKWLKRPCGASFAFGGKLISFSQMKSADPSQRPQNKVTIGKVVTEQNFVAQSSQLEHALHNRQFAEFCSLKINNTKKEDDEMVWKFLKVNFESEPRSRFLSILGFNADEIAGKVAELTQSEAEEVTDKMAELTTDAADAFDQIKQPPEPTMSGSSSSAMTFDSSSGSDGLLTQALLTGNFEMAVDICLHEGRMADAIILANADGPALLQKTMAAYFNRTPGVTTKLISAVVQKDYSSIVENTELSNWKEALAVILTYGRPEEFPALCDKLAQRLELAGDKMSANAILCYICSGNISKFVDCWLGQASHADSPLALQELIEKVMVLRKAVEQLQGTEYHPPANSSLAAKLGKYAELLAAEGSLQTALTYLTGSTQSKYLNTLKHRLQIALGHNPGTSPWPQRQAATPKAQQPRAVNQYGQQKRNPYGSTHMTPSQNGSAGTTTTSSAYNGQSAVNSYPTGSSYQVPTSNYQAPAVSTYQPAVVPTYQPATSVYQPASSAYQAPTSDYQPTSSPYSAGQPSQAYQNYQPASSYLGQNAYGGYGAPKPAGQVAARGLLSKKYAAPGSTAPVISEPVSSPQSFYNPAAQQNSPVYNQANTQAASQFSSQTAYQAPPAPVNIPTVDAARSAPAGWNDPPPVHEKAPAGRKNSGNPAPITAPVYNPAAQTQQYGQQYGGQQYAGQYSGQSQYETGQQYGQQQYGGQQQQQQYSQMSPQAKAEPVQEIPKAPIPAKDQVLKDVLDSLATKCLHASTNPQQKRKLEDVLKKLEFLYDKLRSHSLNDSILTGLHQLVQAIQQYDYASGLNVHTSLVTQGNFSEISAFMPGVKMLMQTAYQLQVFV